MILKKLKSIFAETLDIDPKSINETTFIIRDLQVESIDLLELAVEISSQFQIKINDRVMFLRNLRDILNLDEKIIIQNYPYLRSGRNYEILQELKDGPVLKISDIMDYIQYKKEQHNGI